MLSLAISICLFLPPSVILGTFRRRTRNLLRLLIVRYGFPITPASDTVNHPAHDVGKDVTIPHTVNAHKYPVKRLETITPEPFFLHVFFLLYLQYIICLKIQYSILIIRHKYNINFSSLKIFPVNPLPKGYPLLSFLIFF